LEEADYIGFDTENSGTVRAADLWAGTHYLTGISTSIRPGGFLSNSPLLSWYFSIRHPDSDIDPRHLERLRCALQRTQLGCHNLNIDLPALETAGIEVTKPVWDTTTMFHMVNEEMPSKSLDWLSNFILKDKKDKSKLDRWVKIWGWDDIPTNVIFEYGCHDAELHYRLAEIAYRDMQE
jgi:DNA polymerase I-like protein with 3'-5' exonuclease and polymerase domains